jgi:hypothetical protein
MKQRYAMISDQKKRATVVCSYYWFVVWLINVKLREEPAV